MLKTSILFLLVSLATVIAHESRPPNVILIMTDDQGYGDIGAHGNPILKTPEMDRMRAESVFFSDFHVSSFCTPTRAALLTGNYPSRTGAFRTAGGRSAMHADQKTIANLFSDNGYVTGMVGKWHLGDNAPHRPQDRGFQHALWHRAGGIGQAADYYGNDYYDDHYERATPENRQGTFEKFEGYCTDVWFEESLKFIEAQKDKPFLLYLAPNAPHGPYFVPPEWADPYKVKGVANPNFYGMIANIDHNLGLFRKKLSDLGLAENTILIFMTDNGTAAGAKFKGLESEPVLGYNAGMRGKKSSIFEGGIRVPFFIHWPAGKLAGGQDNPTLSAHIDVMPTLADLCGLSLPEEYPLDGISLMPLFAGEKIDRTHHVEQYHGGPHNSTSFDQPFTFAVVLTERWRYLRTKGEPELYDITTDLIQRNNVIKDHPAVAAQLQGYYDNYWNSVYPGLLKPAHIDLGNPHANPTDLCSQDWFTTGTNPPWSMGAIKRFPKVNYAWKVNLKKAGRYQFTLRQFPELANKPLSALKARVSIAGIEKEVAITPGSKEAVITIDLPKEGEQELWTYLTYKDGKESGAYFTEVELLP